MDTLSLTKEARIYNEEKSISLKSDARKTGQPLVKETWFQSLGWKDLLEKGMATHSSILAWRLPWTRGAWWAIVRGVTRSQTQLSN